MKEDIKRIKEICNIRGIDIEEEDVKKLWLYYSKLNNSAWAGLPKNDNDVFDCLHFHILYGYYFP